MERIKTRGIWGGISANMAWATVFLAATPTQAQTTGESVELTEIVVTAQRRSEAKQETPVAISAFTADTLVAHGIETASDLQSLTPGVVLNGSGSSDNTTFTIRGQGKVPTGPGLPSVLTYVNEVPLQSWGSSPPTFDLDNIQILKGPQGTAFGRNTTGGAVLVYTARPTYNFGGYVQGQFGDYADNEYQGAVNAPIIADKLAIRAAFDIERRDGYTHNLATGQNLDNKHSNAVRFSALMEPTEAIHNIAVFDYIRYNQHGPGVYPFQDLDPALLAATLATLGPHTLNSTDVPYQRATYWGVSNTTTVDLNTVTLKNIFGYRNTSSSIALGTSGLPIAPLPNLGPQAALIITPGALGYYVDTYQTRNDEQFTDEVQLSGSAFDDNLIWLLGGFYLKDKPDGSMSIVLDGFRPLVPTATDLYVANTLFGGAWPVSSLNDGLYTDESKSAFISTTYNLAQLSPVLKGLKLEAGFRFTWDTESVCANGRTVVSLTSASLLAEPALFAQPYSSVSACQADPTTYRASVSYSAPIYTLGLDYVLSDDLFTYFTTRSGYRAGGINTPLMAPSLSAYQEYKPQKATDYEIGLHKKWKVNNWQGLFDIALYQDKYTELQLQATGLQAGQRVGDIVLTGADQPTNTALTLNAGTATFQGVELDGVVSPFTGLNFSYGAAYLNGKYDKLNVAPALQPFFIASSFTGSPRWSVQAGAQYVLLQPSQGGAISVNGNYYWIASEYQGQAQLPAYEVTDFFVEWKNVAGHPVDLTMFVNNAFDSASIQSVSFDSRASISGSVFSGNYAPPRMFGVRLRYTFGR